MSHGLRGILKEKVLFMNKISFVLHLANHHSLNFDIQIFPLL